jgi:hypothetical protein
MPERRRTPRHQLGRVAAILCGPGEERSCLVKDFSDGGVRLQLNGFEIPNDFTLPAAFESVPVQDPSPLDRNQPRTDELGTNIFS